MYFPYLVTLCVVVSLYIDLGSSALCGKFPCQNGTVDRCEKYQILTGASLSTMYVLQYKDEAVCRHSLCCVENTDAAASYRRGPGCLSTKCVPKNTKDPCSSLNLMKADKSMGVRLESVYSESCQTSTGEEGQMAVCCQPGHPEKFLTVGYAAEPNEFPHLVRLNVGCAGTIYNKRWIITAAHCVVRGGQPMNASLIQARMGINIVNNMKTLYNGLELIVHPNYTNLAGNQEKLKGPTRINYDLALVKLDKDIEFGQHIKALPIAPHGFDALEYSNRGIVTGWGFGDNFRQPSLLRKSFVPIREPIVCEAAWGIAGKKFGSEQAICIGGILRNSDGTLNHGVVAGQGDSGGPVMCKDENGYSVLCGVTSYGSSDDLCQILRNEYGCLPNIYTNVGYFNPWIVEHAGNQTWHELYKVKFSGQKVKRPKKYSHQVLISSSDSRKCGGTLVAEDVVVTAAHCVYENMDKTKKLKGNLEAETRLESGGTYKVVENLNPEKWKKGFKINNQLAIFTNPYRKEHFKILDDYYYDNDIAVLKLDRKVPNAKPLDLPPPDFNPFGKGINIKELSWKSEDENYILEKRRSNMLPFAECQRRFSAFNIQIWNKTMEDYSSPEWNPPIKSKNRKPQDETPASSDEQNLEDDIDRRELSELDWILNQMSGPVSIGSENMEFTKMESPKKIVEGGALKNATSSEIINWLRKNIKKFKLSKEDICYVEKYSGGSECDRTLGGALMCTDIGTNKQYLCGVQSFRLCFGSFPNIAFNVVKAQNDIIESMKKRVESQK